MPIGMIGRWKTKAHLIAMLYAQFGGARSLPRDRNN